jgi:hypothetical protein
MAKGRVGYPIVKPGPNCGFGKTGIIDYGIRLNRSERWDAYCHNPHGLLLKIIILCFAKIITQKPVTTKLLRATKRFLKSNDFFFQKEENVVVITNSN